MRDDDLAGEHATTAERVAEYVRNHGALEPERAWIASPFDTWHPNPSYQGPPVPHPELGEEEAIPYRQRCTREDCDEWGEPRHDRYGIYAGRLCDQHWDATGMADWVFDAGYAGEVLEPEDY